MKGLCIILLSIVAAAQVTPPRNPFVICGPGCTESQHEKKVIAITVSVGATAGIVTGIIHAIKLHERNTDKKFHRKRKQADRYAAAEREYRANRTIE